MATTTVGRPGGIDDDGTGSTGDGWGYTELGIQVQDPIDAMIAAAIEFGSDLFTPLGDIGIGTTTVAIGGSYTVGRALTIDGGATQTGVLELGHTTTSDDDETGIVAFVNIGNSAAGAATRKQIVTIKGLVDTSDANADSDSGGHLSIATKPEAGTLTERVRITSTGEVQVGGQTANAEMTTGITTDQGSSSNEVAAWKYDAAAHGMTAEAETNTWGSVRPFNATDGGAMITGLSDVTEALTLRGFYVTDDTAKSGSAIAAITLRAAKKSGTGVTACGADANMVVVMDDTSPRFILDADGDSHQDVGTAWTNFDDLDDVATLNALSVHASRPADPVRAQMMKSLEGMLSREQMTELGLCSFGAAGRPMMNMSKLTMLLVGAARQSGARISRLESRLEALNA